MQGKPHRCMTAMQICRVPLRKRPEQVSISPPKSGPAVNLVRVGGALYGPQSSVNQTVVLGVSADPEPMDATIHAQAQCSMMQADSRTSKLSAANRLELDRGMTRVPFQKFEVLIRKSAHLQGQRCIATPKPCRGGMDHNLR
jgi:alanine racemase